MLEGKDTVPVSSPQTPYLYTHIFQASRGRQFLRKLFATCSVGRPPTALRSLNGFATLAWSVFPLHKLLLLAPLILATIVFLLCIMGNLTPCGRHSLSHIHSMLLRSLLAKRDLTAYCFAKIESNPAIASHPCVEFSTGLFRNVCKQNYRRLPIQRGYGGGSPCKGRQPAEPNHHKPPADCCLWGYGGEAPVKGDSPQEPNQTKLRRLQSQRGVGYNPTGGTEAEPL